MAHVHDENCDDEVFTIHEVRTHLLKEAFGEKQVPAFQEILVRLNKAAYEAYAFKCKATAPVYAAQKKLAAQVPQFWLKSLVNCRPIAEGMFEVADKAVLEFLTDVSIEFQEEDCRDFDVTFSFSKNDYFSNSTLVKSYTVTPPAGSPIPAAGPYDLEADLFHKKCEIKWTDDAHNLCKLSPRVNVQELEEYDEFSSIGSFFNLFGEEGEDQTGSGENFLEWFSHAIEYASGIAELEGGDDDDDDEDEDDEDNFGEEDIGSEEEEKPKKKKAKTAK